MDRNLELIGVGRKAELLLGEFSAYIQRAKEKRLRDLRHAHKTGTLEAAKLASLLASYCSLEEFEADLIRDVKTANLKSKELHDA